MLKHDFRFGISRVESLLQVQNLMRVRSTLQNSMVDEFTGWLKRSW